MNKMIHAEKNTILFVDDEKICHTMLDLIISNSTKYKLINAYNGEEAIELGKRYANDLCLVLSDILMYDISGYKLYEIFQKDEKLKHIPFIFQSGIDPSEIELKKHFMQDVTFIYKPYKQADLIEAIDKVLNTPPGK